MKNNDLMQPSRPANIPTYAETCLRALVANGLNAKISLGGAFGLLHLQPSISATWIDVALDSFPDLVAGKMVALIERGAPRDFRDIYALCQAGLTTPKQCWHVWRQRQQLVGSDTDVHRSV